jgi:hypothetical protein
MNPPPDEQRLDEALKKLRRTLLSASPGSAALVLGAFRAHHEKRRRWRVGILAAVAATLVVVFIAAKLWNSAQTTPITSEGRFIALPYAESGVPLEQGVVIRLDLPSSALVQFGVPPSLRPHSQRVRAEFLIGQDGMARAVRFLPTHTNSF